MYNIFFSKLSLKDATKIKKSNLDKKCAKLLELLSIDPYILVPPYEQLVGDLKGFYSRRINIHHRLIYEIDIENKVVKILRMWSHYE